MFSGYTGISLSVRPSVRPCVYKNISFCQSAGGGIKSHLVTALVCFNSVPDSQDFLGFCSAHLLKTFWEKDIMPSFRPSVHPSLNPSCIFFSLEKLQIFFIVLFCGNNNSNFFEVFDDHLFLFTPKEYF